MSLNNFESALEGLVLESFAEGVAVQGTWEITPTLSVVPSWRITIEKIGDADLPEDGSTFIDD